MTRDEIKTKIDDKLRKIGLEKIQEELSTQFYRMDAAVEALYYGILSGENVILHGPGGYGKSELVKAFMKYTKIPNSTLIGYEDMDVEALMGLPDIKTMLDKSEYVLNFNRSIFKNPGVLILEEFLDVNPRTAMALKDVLTEGGLRQGTKFYESMVTSVVICTNKSPKELDYDKSSSAFYIERFPITVEIKNEFTSLQEYQELIKIMLGKEKYREEHKILAELVFRTSKTTMPVSPRIIKYAMNILKVSDFNIFSLMNITGLDTSDINIVAISYNIKEEDNAVAKLESKIENELDELLHNSMTYRAIMDNIAVIHNIIERLEAMKFKSDDNVVKIANLISKCKTSVDSLWSSIKIPANNLDNIFSDD